MRSDKKFRCRVCGYKSDVPPWGDDEKTPLYDFCPCCGVEHGYQDSAPTGARAYRTKWIAEGAIWEEPESKPEGWEPGKQLENVPPEFR